MVEREDAGKSIMSVLVTGCSGFAGSHLVRELAKDHNELVGIVRDRHDKRVEELKRQLNHVAYVDLQDYAAIERVVLQYSPRLVYHLASFTIVKEANQSPTQAFESNTRGTWNLLEACRIAKSTQQFIYLQTDKALGEGMDLDENAQLQASGPYETSKAMAELAIRSYGSRFDLPFSIVRSCLPAKATIYTENGFKQISRIKIGEKVWTHRGRLRKVTQIYKRRYSGEIYNVVFACSTISTNVHPKTPPHLTCTPEHPVLTARGWIKAQDLVETDMVAVVGKPCAHCRASTFIGKKYCNNKCQTNSIEFQEQMRKRLPSMHALALRARGMSPYEWWVDQLIQRLAPGKFQFGGSGQIRIGPYFPDWIALDQKAIIEFVGRPGRERRGQFRNKVKYLEDSGYRVLVVSDFLQPTKLEQELKAFIGSLNKQIAYLPIRKIVHKTWKSEAPYRVWGYDKTIKKSCSVWNLEVEEDKSYIANWVFVHNCNIYGENDFHPRVITNTIKSLIEKNEAIIYNNVNYVRQYIHVSDVVSALKFVAENPDKTIGETYHIAQTQPITQAQVVTSLCKKWTEITKKEPTIKYEESTVREVANESLNCTKIARLGWKPQVLFEDGIARTIHYWLKEYERR